MTVCKIHSIPSFIYSLASIDWDTNLQSLMLTLHPQSYINDLSPFESDSVIIPLFGFFETDTWIKYTHSATTNDWRLDYLLSGLNTIFWYVVSRKCWFSSYNTGFKLKAQRLHPECHVIKQDFKMSVFVKEVRTVTEMNL